jgi:glutaredoxin
VRRLWPALASACLLLAGGTSGALAGGTSGALAGGTSGALAGGVRSETRVDVEVFVRADCPHCAEAHRFLTELSREDPALVIVERDVLRDEAARVRLETLAAQHRVGIVAVPSFRVGERLIVGFRSPETTGAEIRAALAGREALVELPLLGAVDVRSVGLPLFTIMVGLLDGVNPCAMWVLVFLVSLLAGLEDRRRMALVAGTFVAVSGVAYFVFMLAWLNVFLAVGVSRTLELALGAAAVLIGGVHLKDAVAPGTGPSLAIPASAKPGLYRRMRAVVRAERPIAALLGATTLAVVVNLVELGCTAGLPALYTRILTLRELPTWQYLGYLGLYNVAYVLDDSIVVATAVLTLSRRRLQERGGRALQLVSGGVMLALGLLLWLAPGWLRG